MKFKKILMFILILFILFTGISSISASDDLNTTIEDTALMQTYDDNNLASELESSADDTLTASESKTWTVVVDKKNPNQVLNPTVQPIIDQASPGDTIILKGDFIHCHFLINKTLNIVASDSSLGPCPHHNFPYGSDTFGIFYITAEGSGSVIEGFTFHNDNYNIANVEANPFAVYVDGASDVTVKDCIINWTGTPNGDNDPEKFIYDPIWIYNSDNVVLNNLVINNTVNGITLVNSSNVKIQNSNISNSRKSGILIKENNENITISNNNIFQNSLNAINLTSVNNIQILNNYIYDNGESGVYVNANISKLEIIGNLFIGNEKHAVWYDWGVENLNNNAGDDELAIIDNNLFANHGDMIVHHTIYVSDSKGDYNYNETSNSYYYVGYSNGKYSQDKGYSYMRYAYVYNDIVCGHTYYTTKIPWAMAASANGGKYNLSLTFKIAKISNKIFKASIVDSKGSAASKFNSFYVTFYVNNNESKSVLIKNGEAYADLSSLSTRFIKGNNTITAVLVDSYSDYSPKVSITIDDDGNVINDIVNTKITATKLTTYPLSDEYFKITLTDSDGNVLALKDVSFKINGKTFSAKTNANGVAKLKIGLTAKKTYTATITYAGDDNYNSSKTTAKIIVKAGSKKAKITASNIKVKKNTKKTFKFKLTTSAGKVLASQKVTVKVNGKTYIVKTSSKGVGKLSVKLPKIKKYSISLKFLGNAKYNAVSKKATITVVKK